MNRSKDRFRILIAHQSTIPHYRVAFYQNVKKLKPDWWDFEVIYDENESMRHFYMNPEKSEFNFDVKHSRGLNLDFGGRKLSFQMFPFSSINYDLVIVGQALNNLAYPLTFIRKLFGKPIAYWGQGRDLYTVKKSLLKNITESFKLSLTKRADGFFSYTEGVKNYLIQKGVNPDNIFALQNTLDIEKQRSNYKSLINQRQELRKEFHIENKKVLLYVGRFNREKKIDMILESFIHLNKLDDSYTLLVVGGGDTKLLDNAILKCGPESLKHFGVVADSEIGKYFVMADAFVIAGSVGLNVIQAMCYNLIPIVIDSPFQSPEFEYLTKKNSVILSKDVSSVEYANEIYKLFLNGDLKIKLEATVWDSINHLTIEQMAINFIMGVNTILEKKYKAK